MLHYINNIQSIVDEDKTSFVFHFLQNEPTVDLETQEITTKINTVASIVLDRNGFLELARIVIDELRDADILDDMIQEKKQ